MSTDIRNAKIRSIDVSTEDWVKPILVVDFEGSGWGVGYPGYSGHLAEHISGVLKAAGAGTLRGAVGKPVRIEFEGSTFKSVMHFMDDTIVHDPREMATALSEQGK